MLSRSKVVHIHRSFAIFSIVIIIFAAVSGFLLQHAEDFDWQNKTIKHDWMLDLYGVKKSQKKAYTIINKPQHFAIQLAHQWYINTTLLPNIDETIRGAVYLEPLWIIVSDTQVHLYSNTLEAIESITPDNLKGTIETVGISTNQLLIINTQAGSYQSDADFLTFKAIAYDAQKKVSSVDPLPKNISNMLPKRVSDIRYLRLMQDLHGGRLFGLPHWLIPDLTAFALIFLSLSGLIMKWQRRPRKKH